MIRELHNVTRVSNGQTGFNPTDVVLENGTINVLLNPTLAGKTSLMRLMAGLVPYTGRIL